MYYKYIHTKIPGQLVLKHKILIGELNDRQSKFKDEIAIKMSNEKKIKDTEARKEKEKVSLNEIIESYTSSTNKKYHPVILKEGKKMIYDLMVTKAISGFKKKKQHDNKWLSGYLMDNEGKIDKAKAFTLKFHKVEKKKVHIFTKDGTSTQIRFDDLHVLDFDNLKQINDDEVRKRNEEEEKKKEREKKAKRIFKYTR